MVLLTFKLNFYRKSKSFHQLISFRSGLLFSYFTMLYPFRNLTSFFGGLFIVLFNQILNILLSKRLD